VLFFEKKEMRFCAFVPLPDAKTAILFMLCSICKCKSMRNFGKKTQKALYVQKFVV
jgi:uncharacterized membrane protein YpjA